MCLRPLHYFESDLINSDTGKPYGFITGYQVKVANYNTFQLFKCPCTLAHIATPLVVPCGKCAECKQMIKQRWVGRCIAELEVSNYAYFLTLTMSDDFLHDCKKSDIQNFIKRLRKFVNCRYLAVGEYGSMSNRPHYHLIIFTDEPLKDLTIFKRSSLPIYRSDTIEKCWRFGQSTVGMATASSIAYTVGYITKKEKKTAFKLQSQGLGAKFFSELKERYILSNGRGREVIVYLPRYLRAKYGLQFEFDKDLSELKFKNSLNTSGLSEFEYMNFREFLTNSKLLKW